MDYTTNTDFHIENYLNYKKHNPKLAKDIMFLVCTTELLNDSYKKFPKIIPLIFIDFLNELPYILEQNLKNIKKKKLSTTKIKDYKFLIEGIEKILNNKNLSDKESLTIKDLESQFYEFISICKEEIAILENKNPIAKQDITLKQVALLNFYKNININRENSSAILKPYKNLKSGDKLYQHFLFYQTKANRLGIEETFLKQKHKIELFEKVIKLLEEEKLDSSKAIEESKLIKGKTEEAYPDEYYNQL